MYSQFTHIDVGTNGRVSDGGVFRKYSSPVPFTLVAEYAFAVGPYLKKPYGAKNLTGIERIFNYRLSRARRIIENAFGILSARFRELHFSFLYREMFDVFDHVKKLHGQTNYLIK